MGQNSQKNPYTNRTNFVSVGFNVCGRAFNKVFRGCKNSGKFFLRKSKEYNQRFIKFVAKDWKSNPSNEKKQNKQED
jgi:hypothetical protein